MTATLDEVITGVEHSRQFFLKHLEGVREEQWDWKPYLECKSIRETLVHLIVDDRTAIESIETNAMPDFDAAYHSADAETVRSSEELRALLAQTHTQLLDTIRAKYADKPLDAEICIWGTPGKVVHMVPHLSSEDYYHAGQVSFIRMATDPEWNYYKAVYGIG